MAIVAVECKYVTEDCMREWKSTNNARKLHIEVVPARFIYELCWTVVKGDLPLTKCRVALDAVGLVENPAKEETSSILADTIAHMGQELTVPGEWRSRLIELAKWLVHSELLHVRLLQERCEAEFLWEAEMIRIKANELKSKEVRVNTRLLYQQTKFNLLREESEGYAKLLTLLCQRGPEGLTRQTSSAVISTIKSLIGHFDLDPNRVFDIVLECYELQPDNTAFLDLIPLFPKSHTSQILGFKFQYYQRAEVEDPVPTGLYRLAAILIKEDFIDLDSMYAHLLPKDEDAIEQYEETSRRRIDEANKIGKINLAATGKDLMEDEKPGDVTVYLYAALDMESEAVAERSKEMITNQKLGLLSGFLAVDDWAHANTLFDRLAALHPVAHPQICGGLCRAIEKAITPYYSTIRPSYLSNISSQGSTLAAPAATAADVPKRHSFSPELSKDFFQMLSCIGPYLHRDVLLLQKVCRVLKTYLSNAQASAANPGSGPSDKQENERRDPRNALKEARVRVEESLGSCLLPSLQLLPANPAVGLEIWDVMSLLPYEVRYRLYGEWEKEDERIPMVLAARQTAKLDTRRILKRLAKENLKQLGRMVAKIAHANPMTVLRTIVHQIEAYKDMIAPVVDAFKYLTQLEYDVLEYVVIERLAQGGREKLKEDGLNVSDWLQSLASFWGHLCKKYPSMELRGLFQYLVNQLKKGEGIELVLLQELIQQMASVEYTENVTEDQLEAMAGGETMRIQATAFGVTRNNKAVIKSTNRLRDALFPKDEPKLAVPLLLLIAQQRTTVIVNADAPYIKMVSEQFDRCHGTLLQYVEFLISSVSPLSAYAQLIPSLEDLVHKYHIEPEVAFLIYRPVVRMFKPSKGSSASWPADTSKAGLDLILDMGPQRKSLSWADLLRTVHSMLPAKAWNSLSPELYATFWGLNLHDLYVPRKRYETEMAKQRAAFRVLEESSDNSHAAVAKRKKDKEKIQETLDRLSAELQKQEQNVTNVNQRLVREKDSWLSSCPDSLKINMEFIQRCIFPRCVFSTMDAVYCARFVHTLHSLGTPFFNTVNHIDVFICKTLHPMISCCTEYEAGRLGKFLCETLKMAYHWKSDESIYEKECGNMPGFAVLYRDPNSLRVTYAQYVKVHWKWNSKLTKLLVQCLESTDYMEIRNALTVLTKLSSVYPVLKKSGGNLEKRVNKIKADEREDLKVLAIGVAAALANRKNAWVTDEEFTMGYVDLKPPASPAKPVVPANSGPQAAPATQDPSSTTGAGVKIVPTPAEVISTSEKAPPAAAVQSIPAADSVARPEVVITASNPVKVEQRSAVPSTKSASQTSGLDMKPVVATPVPSTTQPMAKVASNSTSGSGSEVNPRSGGHVGSGAGKAEENSAKPPVKSSEAEPAKPQSRRHTASAIPQQTTSSRSAKPDAVRDDSTRTSALSSQAGEISRISDNSGTRRPTSNTSSSAVPNGSSAPSATTSKSASGRSGERALPQDSSSRSRAQADTSTRNEVGLKVELSGSKPSDGKNATAERERERQEVRETGPVINHHRPVSKSPRREEVGPPVKPIEDSASKERQSKRTVVTEDVDRLKRRKGDSAEKNSEQGELRPSDRSERIIEQRPSVERPRSVERDRGGHEDRTSERNMERSDKGKDRSGERVERDHRAPERAPDRSEKDRGEDHTTEKFRDRSTDKLARERSVDRGSDRAVDRNFDRVVDRGRDDRTKEDRARPRYMDPSAEQPHPDDRFPMQNLPPPPPLPPNVTPQSVSRREDDIDRRSRGLPRMSPRREEKIEKRRIDDGNSLPVDDTKRRRDDEVRERKREERDLPAKMEKEREREKERALAAKEEAESSAKRRRLKRGDIQPELPINFGPSPPPPVGMPPVYEGRDRDRKGGALPRGVYIDDMVYDKGSSGGRVHTKEANKLTRRDHDPMYEREWEEDKRQRGDLKHHRRSRK